MRKRMWKRLVSIVCVLAMVGSWSASAQTPKGVIASEETLTVAEPTVSMLPQNIQMLLENAEQTDVVIPSDNPYELTVRHADGTYTTEVYSVPVKYTDAEGKTQYVDTSMQERTLWQTLTFNDTRYNQEGYVALAYDEDIDDGISVDEAFTLSVPVRDEQESARCVTAEDGSGKIIYPQAFGEHTYVEYINTYTGFKENIVLEQNIGQNTFDFVWESDTHIPVLIDDNKAIKIVQKGNRQQADYTISPLYVYDSFDPTTSDDPYSHKHWTEDCRYDIIEKEDGTYIIRAIVSEEYLNHPETVYPVIIDPSVTADYSEANVEDGYVTESDPTEPHGGYNYLRFGYSGGKIYSYVKYNWLPTLPAGAYFTSATFKVTFRTGQNTPANVKGAVKTVQGDFSETNLTWNNKPTPQTTISSVLPVISDGYLDYYNFTVTSAVKNWYTLANHNYGLVFTYENETYNDYNSVASSEDDAGRGPKLTLNYSVATSETSGITDDGYYFIRNRATGKYLTLSEGGMSVELADYTGASNQLWQTQYQGSGGYYLVPRANTARCLRSGADMDGGAVGAYAIPSATDPVDERNACLFRITLLGTGRYRFASKATSAFYATTGGRMYDMDVSVYTYTGATDQQWYFEEYSLSLTPQSDWVVARSNMMTITPSTSALNLTWDTSDRYVAIVAGNANYANFYGLTPGTVTITATAENGVSASCTITVRDPDPFHPDNIEYVRVKKYDQSSSGGDGDITTIVTKSIIDSSEYFEVYAPDRANLSFEINQALIDELNSRIESYLAFPTIGMTPNYYYYWAKLGVDVMVENNIISANSAEYYGIWASEANRLLMIANQVSSVVQLTYAVVTSAYNTYNIVTAIKTAQMSMNTTRTCYATDYRSTAYIADDLTEMMTNNSNSRTVMLGTEANGISWYEIADQEGMSFFFSENYNAYVSQYGSDAMLAANKTFIYNAKEAGKTFWFSHSPIDQLINYPNSTFAYELQYLKRLYEISEFVLNDNIFKSGDYYYLVP